MSNIPIIPFAEGDALLDWIGFTDALAAGHDLPPAEIGDTFLYRDPDTLLNHSAWIDGLGIAVKLARPDSENILIVGAGTVGHNLHAAYSAAFPKARFTVWNRTRANADKMAQEVDGLQVADDLETAVRAADIITSATMSTEPLIMGDWLQPGQHVDLIGAYRPDMREVDDAALQKSRVFVDSFDTTIGHIGEINIPLESGAITRDHLLADYYDIHAFKRRSDDEITLFKNGGGAHLDLMTSRYILDRWKAGK